MSQIDKHKVSRLQWEIPNPQYFPDDNAPPLPSSSITTVEQNSLPFNNSQDAVSYAQDGEVMTSVTDQDRFTGIPTASKFDYRTGLTELEIDHIFYSYLNVDVSIPYKFIGNQSRHFNFVFRHFIPALCGLYTIEVPPEGHHLAYWMNTSDPAHNVYSFAINGLGKQMFTHYFWRDGIVNQFPESVRKYDYIDFVFEFQDDSYGEAFTYTTANYDITFHFQGTYVSGSTKTLEVSIRDSSSDSSESTVIGTFDLTGHDFDELFILRMNFSEENLSLMSWKSGEHSIVTKPFTNIPSNTGFSVLRMDYRPTAPKSSCQIIGYNVETDMADLYGDVIRPKNHWRYPIASGDLNNADKFVLPPYQGNAWEYYNKIFSMYPFRWLI